MTTLSPRSLFLRTHTLKRKTDNLHIELDAAIKQKSNVNLSVRHAADIGQNFISVSTDTKVPAVTGLPVVGIIICPELDTVLFQSRFRFALCTPACSASGSSISSEARYDKVSTLLSNVALNNTVAIEKDIDTHTPIMEYVRSAQKFMTSWTSSWPVHSRIFNNGNGVGRDGVALSTPYRLSASNVSEQASHAPMTTDYSSLASVSSSSLHDKEDVVDRKPKPQIIVDTSFSDQPIRSTGIFFSNEFVKHTSDMAAQWFASEQLVLTSELSAENTSFLNLYRTAEFAAAHFSSLSYRLYCDSRQLWLKRFPHCWTALPVNSLSIETPTRLFLPWATVKNIVIIGVHGWALLGGVLSDAQRLNSAKFCGLMANAIRSEIELSRSASSSSLSIVEVALVGHGSIELRVADYLDSQLLQYESNLQNADLVVVAAHSQGCVVAALLLETLLKSRRLNPRHQQICVMAMNGVHHGPFPDTPSDLYPATKELFVLSQSHAPLVRKYHHAWCFLLNCGVKVFAIGSWHDQVVPLFSALLWGIGSAPVFSITSANTGADFGHLMRAVFVEADLYKGDDFLIALVRLCILVRNLGKSADLLVHLSGYLRGRLLQMRPGAHSVLHSSPETFALAARWFLSFPTSAGSDTSHDDPALSDVYFSPQIYILPENRFPARFHRDSYFVDTQSTTHMAPLYTETFTATSDLNKFLVYSRTQHLLITAVELHLHIELNHLCELFLNWQPAFDNRLLWSLRRILEPLFDNERNSTRQPIHSKL